MVKTLTLVKAAAAFDKRVVVVPFIRALVEAAVDYIPSKE